MLLLLLLLLLLLATLEIAVLFLDNNKVNFHVSKEEKQNLLDSPLGKFDLQKSIQAIISSRSSSVQVQAFTDCWLFLNQINRPGPGELESFWME
jgi:hypothetical protein